jgi:hypothetical protein
MSQGQSIDPKSNHLSIWPSFGQRNKGGADSDKSEWIKQGKCSNLWNAVKQKEVNQNDFAQTDFAQTELAKTMFCKSGIQ